MPVLSISASHAKEGELYYERRVDNDETIMVSRQILMEINLVILCILRRMLMSILPRDHFSLPAWPVLVSITLASNPSSCFKEVECHIWMTVISVGTKLTKRKTKGHL